MSDHSDRMIMYIEDHWQDLAEKFIEKNYTKPVISWEDFTFKMFEQYCIDSNWEPDE